jgi:hypothetical protein
MVSMLDSSLRWNDKERKAGGATLNSRSGQKWQEKEKGAGYYARPCRELLISP